MRLCMLIRTEQQGLFGFYRSVRPEDDRHHFHCILAVLDRSLAEGADRILIV